MAQPARTSLDRRSRIHQAHVLKGLQQESGIPMIFVSHAMEEVSLLCDQLVLLEGGRVEAQGRPSEIFARTDLSLASRDDAGVMLAATAFSLIVPGIAAAESLGLTPWSASGLICFGIMLGAFGLYLVDLKLSGASPEMLVGTPEHPVIPPRIWLFVFAIIAHNIPEGMAVGVSAGGGMPDADSLAMGIALQDVPEGLVIALVLAGAGMSRVKAFLIGAASGLVEPVFALLCAWLVSLAELLLPLGLALAAGAMLLVVTHEVIPESRRNGHDKLASLGLLIGFCLMMVMDTALG